MTLTFWKIDKWLACCQPQETREEQIFQTYLINDPNNFAHGQILHRWT